MQTKKKPKPNRLWLQSDDLFQNMEHLYQQANHHRFYMNYKEKQFHLLILRLPKRSYEKHHLYMIRSVDISSQEQLFHMKMSIYPHPFLQNYVYVDEISKTDDGYTIYDVMRMLLSIFKSLHVKSSGLHDATTVYCKDKTISLQYYMLLKKNHTFYSKFGYQRVPECRVTYRLGNISNLGKYTTYFENKLQLFKKITSQSFLSKLDSLQTTDQTAPKLTKLKKSIQEKNDLTFLYEYIIDAYDEECENVLLYNEFSEAIFNKESEQFFLQNESEMILFLDKYASLPYKKKLNETVNNISLLENLVNVKDPSYHITKVNKKAFEVNDKYYLMRNDNSFQIELFYHHQQLHGRCHRVIDFEKDFHMMNLFFSKCHSLGVMEVDCLTLDSSLIFFMLDSNNINAPLLRQLYVSGPNVLQNEIPLIDFIQEELLNTLYVLNTDELLQQYQGIDWTSSHCREEEFVKRSIQLMIQQLSIVSDYKALLTAVKTNIELKDFVTNRRKETAEYQYELLNHQLLLHFEYLTLKWKK